MKCGRKIEYHGTKEELIKRILKFKRIYKRRQTAEDCMRYFDVSIHCYFRAFGTWANALRIAGITEAEIKEHQGNNYTRIYYENEYVRPKELQDEIDEYKRIQANTGR